MSEADENQAGGFAHGTSLGQEVSGLALVDKSCEPAYGFLHLLGPDLVLRSCFDIGTEQISELGAKWLLRPGLQSPELNA